jgi:hypothetical protein
MILKNRIKYFFHKRPQRRIMAMITQNSFSLFSFFSLDGKERNKPACRRLGKD